MQLLNKTVVITGSTSGIGRAIALAMARAGADVLVHGRNAELAAETAAEIAASYSWTNLSKKVTTHPSCLSPTGAGIHPDCDECKLTRWIRNDG